MVSTPIHKYAYVRCAVFGLGRCCSSVTDRWRVCSLVAPSPKPNTAQPSGRQVFLRQTSLLAPYRPLTGMLVARASSGTKIPCRERMRIYELGYLVPPRCFNKWLQLGHQPGKTVQRELLRAVAQCLRGVRVNLNQQPVCAHGNRTLAHGGN